MSPFLIVLISVLAGWAVLATVMATVWGRGLRREREAHDEARERSARHRATARQLEQQAVAVAQRLEALQREHAALQRAQAERPGTTPGQSPVHLLAAESLDVSGEVGILFEHVGRVAMAIRDYSAYTRGHYRQESNKARYDLLWLADCLHTFDRVGRALASGSTRALVTACDELLSMYDTYLHDGSGYDSRDTFRRLAERVPLSGVIEAIRALAAKAAESAQATAQRQAEEISPAAATV